jgi:cytochrome b pre-mRNA-processing protein 3
VPKRMRGFAEAFYGREAAYLTALAATDEKDLEAALTRNIFQGTANEGGATRLANYARGTLRRLETQDKRDLQRGEIVFPQP